MMNTMFGRRGASCAPDATDDSRTAQNATNQFIRRAIAPPR